MIQGFVKDMQYITNGVRLSLFFLKTSFNVSTTVRKHIKYLRDEVPLIHCFSLNCPYRACETAYLKVGDKIKNLELVWVDEPSPVVRITMGDLRDASRNGNLSLVVDGVEYPFDYAED